MGQDGKRALSRLASPHIDSTSTPSSQSRRIAEDRVKKLSPEDNRQPSRIECAKCCRLRCDLNICLSFKGRWLHTEMTKIAIANRPRFRLLLAVAYGAYCGLLMPAVITVSTLLGQPRLQACCSKSLPELGKNQSRSCKLRPNIHSCR
jgi:hypothetical protein